MKRLNLSNVASISNKVAQPVYNPIEHGVGILHIGIGAFHRGHQAVFTDDALAVSGGDWRIVGVSLRSSTVADQLNPQDGLYTVSEKDGGTTHSRIIASVKKVISARDDRQNKESELDRYFTNPLTRIVTLTVTEKGYHFDQSTGTINWQSPDIQNDLLYPDSPKSMPGYLVRACKLRMESEGSLTTKGNLRLTVISCDNLPDNGHVTQTVVMALANKLDSNLAEWISNNVSFCSSMVDRIVPKITQDDIAEHIKQNEYDDQGLVITEPFKQWVVEDNFCTERPDWAAAGVLFVKNVTDYEKLKLRTLNGAHSALAYMGVLLDLTYVHEAIQTPLLNKLINKMMKAESGPTIPDFENVNLAEYQQQIIARFVNSDIAYETQQVASDGSQKLPQRILAPLLDLYSAGKQAEKTVLLATFVCWLRYLRRTTESGANFMVSDPIAPTLIEIVDAHWASPTNLVNALFTQTSIVPNELQINTGFRQDLAKNLSIIKEQGVLSYLQTLI